VLLDGVNDYVSASNPITFDITGPISVVGWVKRSRLQNWERIAGKYYYSTATGNTGSWEMDTGQGALRCIFNIGGSWKNAQAPINTFNQTDQWYLVGCVYDGTALKNYINGVEQASIPASGNVAVTSYPVTLGTTSNGTNNQNYFQGVIDEVQIYNRALSAAEIQEVYNLGNDITPPTRSNGSPSGTLPCYL
jgi:hypothetical protein